MHPRTKILLLLSSFLLLCSLTQAQVVFDDPGFTAETILTLPAFSIVGAAFAPDGRLFIWQREGIIRIYKNGQLLPTPFIDISANVNIGGDRGLLGVAIDHDLAVNGYVYLLYVFEGNNDPNSHNPRTARLTRVTADPNNPDVALPGSEITLIGSVATLPCPPNSDCISDVSDSHTIGTVLMAPDHTLFVGSGDGASYVFADPLALRTFDLTSLNGKILRISPDGTAPVNNPFYDGTNSNQSKIWAYGLRNPFRFTLDPIVGEPLIGDVGWNDWEEINRGRGVNFGWPCFEGNSPQPAYQAAFTQCQQMDPTTITYPIHTYNHSVGATVVGGIYYTADQYPDQYQGNFFFGDYASSWIKRIVFDSNQNVVNVKDFASNADAPVSFALGPDGLIYYVSITTGELRRINFDGPFANASADPTFGYSPLDVAFSSAGSSDPNGQTLTFFWDFGDSNTSTEADPSHTYVSGTVQTFVATLTVTNEDNKSSSDSVSITVGSLPPQPTIDTPPDGTVVNPGDIVNFSGHATDPDDGNLPVSALHWTVYLHHNQHLHTVLELDGVSGGSFIAQDHGLGTYSYEIILTATDSSGLTGSTSVHLPLNAPPCPTIDLSPATLPDAMVGIAYLETIVASGGMAPYGYSVSAGSLPPGLSLNAATGTISGTPTTAGTFDFTITATDSDLCTGSRDYSIAVADVGCPVITLSPTTLPNGFLGSPYNQIIMASGGTAPYTYSVSSGALPDGLSLNSVTGLISGTPTAQGTFNFTITATDFNACTGSRNYSVTINGSCMFCDDFEDGVLDPNWTYVKPNWIESGGDLQGTSTKKAIAIATPVFSGCLNCTIQTSLQTQGGPGNRVWLLGWYIDKKNKVELLMKEESDVWVLKQRSNGSVVAKVKATATIDPNVGYAIVVSFDGTQFTVTVEGNQLITLTAVGTVPSGTVGFQVKATTGSFDFINVN